MLGSIESRFPQRSILAIDVLVVLWTLAWVVLGVAVGSFVARLGAAGEGLEDAGGAIVRAGDSVDSSRTCRSSARASTRWRARSGGWAATRPNGAGRSGTTSIGSLCSWAPGWRSGRRSRCSCSGSRRACRASANDARSRGRSGPATGSRCPISRTAPWRPAGSASSSGERRPRGRPDVRSIRGPREAGAGASGAPDDAEARGLAGALSWKAASPRPAIAGPSGSPRTTSRGAGRIRTRDTRVKAPCSDQTELPPLAPDARGAAPDPSDRGSTSNRHLGRNVPGG